MRPIEALLIFANLVTFFFFAVPLPRLRRWITYSPLIALFIAVAQVLVEGPRWQMLPAYALTGLFFLVWLRQRSQTRGTPHGIERAHRLAVGLSRGLAVLGLAASIALPTVLPVFHFPRPSGPYQIGTVTYHWVDTSRHEIFSTDPNARRELMVQIWYPAEPTGTKTRAPYLQDPAVLGPLAKLLHLPGSLFGYLRYVRTNAIPLARVADAEPNYPVLIFSHGRGGFRQENTFQVEELVSHGYTVAAIDHTYAASGVRFPDGRLAMLDTRMLDRKFEDSMISYFSQDAVFTLNQLADLNETDSDGILTRRLDLGRVGIFGLSMGGAVSAEACRLEPRFRACVVMDVWMPTDVVREGLHQPTMFISRDAATMRREGWRPVDIDETLNTMRAAYEASSGDRYWVLIPGMFHQNPSDFPLAIPAPLGRWIGLIGPIDAQRGYHIVNAYSLAFFDRHLKDRATTLLDGPAVQYPEVLFEVLRAPQGPQ